MTPSQSSYRRAIIALCALALSALAACSSDGSDAGPGPTSSTPTSTQGLGPDGEQPAAASADATELASQVASAFTQETFRDPRTGAALPYNLFLPAGYSSAKEYPLVLFIGDASLVGGDVTTPLSQYGALVWASERDQREHESIVVVPQYPSVIIDDRDAYATTDYVQMTKRLIDAVDDKYSVDEDRVYGTGQSMGCMTILELAANDSDLFAAELFVSGQWDKGRLGGLTRETFVYVAAGGDDRATRGQKEVQQLLDDARVRYGAADLDATWAESELNAAAEKLLSDGDRANFITFTTGSVLSAAPQPSDGQDGLVGEHMASFEPAYKIPAIRDWLFRQTDADDDDPDDADEPDDDTDVD